MSDADFNAGVRAAAELAARYDTGDGAQGAILALLRPEAPAPVPVVWQRLSEKCYRWPAPLFGSIRIEQYGDGPWHVLWSVPGYCESFIDGRFSHVENAKAAAEKRIHEALHATSEPQP